MLQDLNKTIPVEILKGIFEKLEEKKDLFTCLSVSKSWCLAAQELLKNGIPVFVYESELSSMLEDIPSFGYKVKSITLKDQPDYIHDRLASSLIFQKIYLQCPNIVSLFFRFTDVYHYLYNLHHSKAKLSLLDNIDIDNFERCPIQTQELYARIHGLYLRKTIKSLSITSEFYSLSYGYGASDIDTMVSGYRRLTTLKIFGEKLKENKLRIDLINMFELSPQLKEVIMQQVKGIGYYKWQENGLTAHPKVTKLSVKTQKMDLKSLEYIATHLKKLEYLYLDIDKLVADTDLSENELMVLFNDLISHTNRIKKLFISYCYAGMNYYLENGGNHRIEPVEENDSFDGGFTGLFTFD
ncbi:hypothetical protein BD770DRAFT_388337 [Pilaira anomala]|nr:hypothetical protein BD770DRAFT_388337 [Pilaira anomala]